MSATVSVSMRDELAALVGAGSASESEADLRHCTADEVIPAVLVIPANAAEAATVVQHAAGHDWTVLPAGGCTKLAMGNIPQRSDMVLSVSRMDSVLHYDAGDLTIGIEAGMKLVDLHRQLVIRQEPHQPAQMHRLVKPGRHLIRRDVPVRRHIGIGAIDREEPGRRAICQL